MSGRTVGGLVVTVMTTPSTARAAAGLAAWLARAAPSSARGAVTVAIMGDLRMRRLNAAFRSIDCATDVLSFPATGPEVATVGAADRHAGGPLAGPKVRRASRRDLGDIAIASGVATRQAAAQGHTLRTELRVLTLHGLLHLLGYDHERDRGTMHRLEERLRRRAGVPSGLIARAPVPPRVR